MTKPGESPLVDGLRLRPRWGQVALSVVLVGLVGVLATWSLSSMQTHETERTQVFGEEGDASAMVYAQRESFNVLLGIREWAQGEASGRDVQITRALLGQRLTVETTSGVHTADLAHPEYRVALDRLDVWLLDIADVADTERIAYFASMSEDFDAFVRETRQLDKTFQQVTREQTQRTLDERAQSELGQAIILGLIVVLGGGLATWVSIDIVRGYRAVSRKIAQEQQFLDRARQRLELVRALDVKGARWSSALAENAPAGTILSTIAADIAELGHGLVIDVDTRADAGRTVSVCTLPDAGLDKEDIAILVRRAEDAVTMLQTRDAAYSALEYQRHHDALTGLSNRELFASKVARRMANRVGTEVVAVIITDIDRFRDLNAALGYATGDEVLRATATTLRAHTDGAENIARLSGDEFAVVGTYDSAAAAADRVREISDVLNVRMMLAGVESEISVSIGYALDAGQVDDAGELIRHASAAIYLAKAESERNGVLQFSFDEHGHMLSTWHDELAVRNALRAGEFKLFYQPLIDLESGRPVGAEALIRWDRPGVGLVAPDDFLPIVQRAGISLEVGWFVIEEAMQCWRRNVNTSDPDRVLPLPYLSVNLDAEQLEDASLAAYIIGSAERNDVPMNCVVLEVTEHALASGDHVLRQLEVLRAAGARVALDDFGTGYSNLGQAQNLPLDILKIDRSFLPVDGHSHQSWRLISDIKRMADTLNVAVVVEGIETLDMVNSLRELGIDFGQGYYFSKPVPEDQLTAWWDTRMDDLNLVS